MKKLLIIFMLIPIFSFGQKKSGDIILMDYKPEHKGTPYLYNNWKTGYIIINDSIISSQKKIQYNLENGDLIIGSNKAEMGVVITDKSVTGFAINKQDNVTNINRHVFARVKATDFENSNGKYKFYEVISNLDKTNYLIKDVEKYIFDPNKSRGYQTQNSIPQEYKEKTSYYIKNKSGKYIKTKLRKKNVLKILEDKSSEIRAFISSNNINFNKEYEVVRVINYYHTL